jgi:hypothetical protein
VPQLVFALPPKEVREKGQTIYSDLLAMLDATKNWSSSSRIPFLRRLFPQPTGTATHRCCENFALFDSLTGADR